ncbi:MAG TPA: IS110 family transposase [Actinomycetes bacterium]|nr:IS110 family transposase [Actinomycetes bacterium]
MFAGIDWGAQTHELCVLDHTGKRVDRLRVAHSAEGLQRLTARLARHGTPGQVPVAVERPDGRLVDYLLHAGHPVVAVKPNAIKAWREGEVLSGAKSDPGDARLIAEYLRVRYQQLRMLRPFGDQTRALRALVRSRTELVRQRVAAGNQLRATLEAFWPGAAGIFAELTSPIAVAFLSRFPTPATAAGLTESRLAEFLARRRYSGRRSPADLLSRLRSAPLGITSGLEMLARGQVVLAMVRILDALNRSIAALEGSIATHLDQHPDAPIFCSLPRSGCINAAQLLAEWGDCRDVYATPAAVAALAGATPVTKQSGKHRSVHFRWSCNKRLRTAMTTFADNSRHASPWAASVYANAIARGHDHPHALRVLSRAWIRVIWRCWQDQTPYDPARHGNASKLTQTATTAA